MASRPAAQRTPTTNLSGSSRRELDGKLAIVTGASRGIGAAVAGNLAAKGANLVLGYTSEKSKSQIESFAKELESNHSISTLIVQADVSEAGGPAHLVQTAKNHFAHPKTNKFQIDIIINNAGIAINGTIQDTKVEDFERIYKVNVLGPLLLIKEAQEYLPNDRSGRIVNVSSISASAGLPGQSLYGGTKAALEAMTRTWARELVERATVNAINPGPVATGMWAATSADFKEAVRPYAETTPLMAMREGIDSQEFIEESKPMRGRPAYPEEIGGIVGMLCTKDSAWCTGQTVCANGGMRFAF